MTNANHRFLDEVRRILEHGKPAFRRREQYDAPGHAELERRGWILIYESLLDRRFVGFKAVEHGVDLTKEIDETLGERLALARTGDTVGDMGETISLDVEHAPAGVAQPRVESEQTHDDILERGCRRDQALKRAMTSSETSKLAYTFCTSSLSSSVSSSLNSASAA